MKQQVVILAINYDETRFLPPSTWDFNELLETPVEIVMTGMLTTP